MTERLTRDLELVRGRYPDIQFQEEGQWVLLPCYIVSPGWKQKEYAVCFQVHVGYPDVTPYGINVSPPPVREDGAAIQNYVANPEPKPPFSGEWGRFSWVVDPWRATPDLVSGSNLLSFVESIRKRFEEGP